MTKNPVAIFGGTINRWAMQRVLIGSAPNLDLVSVDDSFANSAEPFVIERIPAPMIVDRLKNHESFVGAGLLHVSH